MLLLSIWRNIVFTNLTCEVTITDSDLSDKPFFPGYIPPIALLTLVSLNVPITSDKLTQT